MYRNGCCVMEASFWNTSSDGGGIERVLGKETGVSIRLRENPSVIA